MTEQPNRTRSRLARHTQSENGEAAKEQEMFSVPAEHEDLSAYYGRRRSGDTEAGQPAFAPPPKMEQLMSSVTPKEAKVWEQGNIYSPRKMMREDETLDAGLSAAGYQVQEEQIPAPKPPKSSHLVRNVLIAVLVFSMTAAGLWMAGKPLLQMLAGEEQPEETVTAAAITPEPIKAYDQAPAAEIALSTRNAISELSGTVSMETYLVTDSHVVTRNLRQNGSYDFYVFTAREGRLLCYFEGLQRQDLIPLQQGGFYVRQSPYLVAGNGSAMIRTSDVEAQINEKIILHPLYRGWAVMEASNEYNYISRDGQVLSTLWFSRAYPFTGNCTLAYVDTGSTVAQRYLLYVIENNGSMARWFAADDMTDVVVSACGMAYMKNGDLYRLPETDAPVLNTQEVHLYLDCNAMVAKDAESGKYGLFVCGEKQYDFVYDSICPVESDIPWSSETVTGGNASCTLYAVEAEAYPLPLSHSFVLERGGQREYVALSTESSFPVLLDGEF